MMQEYRDILEKLENGDYTCTFPWEKHGPLWILNHDGTGTIKIGDVRLFDNVRIRVGPRAVVEIEDYVHINHRTEIHSRKKVHIGKYCSIAWDVVIMDTDYHGIGENSCVSRPVTLQESAWIGNNVIITKGVTVGRGAVVAAGSVVNKDVAPFTIVGGNPARFIKEIAPFEGKHGQPYEAKWWDPAFVPKPLPD